MKRLTLLAIAIITTMTCFAENAFDHAYWIIKDGKFTKNFNIKPYTDNSAADSLVETIKDGVPAVEFRKITKDYLDPRILFDANDPLNLETNYIMVMEYMIPSQHADTNLIKEGNKPLFIIGLAPQESDLEAKNAPHSDALIFVDAKWGPTEQWVSTYKYVYANPAFKTMSGMILSYAREYRTGDITNFPYIRNLCFVPTEDNVKPFYAENFTSYNIGEFYGEMHYIRHVSAKKDNMILEEYFNGGIKPVVTEGDKSKGLRSFRDFVDDSLRNSDGSGYYDDEILQALRIESIATRDSVVIPGIAIPEGTKKIYSEMLIKKYKNEDGASIDADYSVVANQDMPIKYKFNTGEIVDVANDTMKWIWTKFKGEVAVPEGATTVDLIFTPMEVGYLVDEILLSSAMFTDVKEFMAENNDFEIISYVDNDGKIIVLNGELQAIYNLNGRLASENDKVVVILVKNEKGKMASKIIIR